MQNYNHLANTKLRKDAFDILEAGLKAIDTKRATKKKIKRKGKTLLIGKKKYNLGKYKNIYVIGIGKASFDCAVALEKILGRYIKDGIVLDVKGGKLKRMKSIVGTHPFPSLANMRATGEIMGILKGVDSNDLVITIVSGGGSALLCWPYDLKCDDIQAITQTLMKKGASIQEMNTVRKHTSEIQGGQFARMAHPAKIIGLIFSDIPGDDLSLVASGPTYKDETTIQQAAKVMKKYNVLKSCKLPSCNLRETPKDDVFFKKIDNHLIVSNVVAAQAMLKKAQARKYSARILSTSLTGEAKKVGKRMAGLPKVGEAIIAAGETTVTLGHNPGKGGRNQELALAALPHLKDNTLVLSCASDGRDNTDCAGGFADELVAKTVKKLNLDLGWYLRTHSTYDFYKQTKCCIHTGITGANVSDLILSIRLK